jgi:kumamolisin
MFRVTPTPRQDTRSEPTGKGVVLGGTSAVAPLWAGLIVRFNQKLGRPIGCLNPELYQKLSAAKSTGGFRDITSGNNGTYSAKPGWDACTGFVSPDGSKLLESILSS